MIERPYHPRPEHSPRRGVTIADCGLIVLGCALVLALPLPEPWEDPGSQDAVLRWCGRLSLVWQWIARTGLALLCIAVFRATRDGRPIRPAELLLAVIAGPVLAEAVDGSPWISGSTYQIPIGQQPNSYQLLPGGPFWWTHASVVAVGIGAAITLLYARRYLPAFLVSLLLVVIALSAAWLSAPTSHAMYAWRALHAPVSLVAERTVGLIQRAISGLIPATVIVLAVRELSRRRALSTLGCIGLALVSASFLISVAYPFILLLGTGAPVEMTLTHSFFTIAGPLASLGLSLILLISLRRVLDPPAGPSPLSSSTRITVPSHRASRSTGT